MQSGIIQIQQFSFPKNLLELQMAMNLYHFEWHGLKSISRFLQDYQLEAKPTEKKDMSLDFCKSRIMLSLQFWMHLCSRLRLTDYDFQGIDQFDLEAHQLKTIPHRMDHNPNVYRFRNNSILRHRSHQFDQNIA